MNSHVKTQFNLPPIARRQTQPIEFDKIEQFVHQSPIPIKQKRTQSMYSLETMDLKTKQRTKISPRKNIKDAYNKWYVPPKKRFLDLRKESEEFLQEQYIINTYAQQQVKYSQILRESKQLAQFVEQFQKQYKRNPTFIH